VQSRCFVNYLGTGASLLRPKWKSLGRGVGICEGERDSRLLASLRRFRRAASIAQCSPTAGFRMLSSMWLRMALRAVATRSANLLRSVSHTAASYKDSQSELESAVSIEEITWNGNRRTVSNEPQFLQSCSGRGNALDIGFNECNRDLSIVICQRCAIRDLLTASTVRPRAA